jgi:ATP-binding cassette subfamily B protein
MKTLRRRQSLFLALWPYARAHRGTIALALLFMVVDTLTSLAAPWPIKLIFDNVLLGKPLHHFWTQIIPAAVSADRPTLLVVLCGALLVFALIGAGASYAGARLLTVAGQQVIFRLRCALFAHLQVLSPSFYDRQRLGDLLTRLTSDVQSIQDMLVLALPTMLLSGLVIGGMIAVLLVINPIFGALATVIALGVYLVLRHYLRRIKHVARQTRIHEGEASALAQENLLGIRVVQAFGLEGLAEARYHERTGRVLHWGQIGARLQAGLPAVVGLLTDLGTLLLLAAGGTLVLMGSISIGDLLVCNSYLRSMYSPLRQLGKLGNTFTRATASAERVLDLMNTVPAIADLPAARPAPKFRGAVAFDKVCFGYDPSQPVLHDISFQIRPGMLVALVGHTGAGKSSILHLLQRFYDPQEGCISIDGTDIRDWTLATLREQIALVPQDPMLFRASVRENIAYGRPGATDAEIVAAARAANADSFISRLPQGYATVLEERGVGLSGGERQRIAIARAMVRQAPLLLLDEPTTGLDALSEQSVVEALERLTVGRTTIVSAHRLSTIQHADLILVVEQGRLVEAGTPGELLAARGYYYRYHEMQFRSPLPLVARSA